jgi:hypothetical protein
LASDKLKGLILEMGEMFLLFIRSWSPFFSKYDFGVAVKMGTIYPTPRQTEREVSRNIIITDLNIVNMNSQSCVSFMRKFLRLLLESWVPLVYTFLWKSDFSRKHI